MSTSEHKLEEFSILGHVKGALFKAAFVLGSAFLVFESARNSLTWYAIKFWGGAGDVWQKLWEKVLDITGIFVEFFIKEC